MTEPTWKDELLQELLQETRDVAMCEGIWAASKGKKGAWTLEEYAQHKSNLNHLRSLINAELARGRRAKERAAAMVRSWETEDNSPAYAVARTILEAFREREWRGDSNPREWLVCPVCRKYDDEGHAPDCRLARVIA